MFIPNRRSALCRALERAVLFLAIFTLLAMMIHSEVPSQTMNTITTYTTYTVDKLKSYPPLADRFPTLYSKTWPKSAKLEPAPSQYISKLEDVREGKLRPVSEVTTPEPEAINLGMVMINLSKNKSATPTYKFGFASTTLTTLDSIFTRTSQKPVHLIIVTEPGSSGWAGKILAYYITKRLSLDVIQTRWWTYKKTDRLPSLYFSMVDSEEILQKNTDFVAGMMNNLMPTDRSKDKYINNFFYIAPLYHLAFTNLDRAVFIDCSDLQFTIDVAELYEQFESLDKTDAIMMLGLDLTPHYFMFLKNYIAKYPDTHLGQPGRYQGFNTGVVLYRFDRMRENKLYNSYLTSKKVKELVDLYLYPISLAEQDFFTNLGFSHPGLFHVLPCTFNRQTSIQYLREPYLDTFDLYHNCGRKEDVKIFHLNGCGPTPKECGNTLPPNSKYTNEQFQFVELNMQIFWLIMESVHTQDWRWVDQYPPPPEEELAKHRRK